MSNEPEREIEQTLRTYAKQRREDAGAPLEPHPATRNLLQREAAQLAPPTPQTGGRRFTFGSLWLRAAVAGAFILCAGAGLVWWKKTGTGDGALQMASNGARAGGGLAPEEIIPGGTPTVTAPAPAPVAMPPPSVAQIELKAPPPAEAAKKDSSLASDVSALTLAKGATAQEKAAGSKSLSLDEPPPVEAGRFDSKLSPAVVTATPAQDGLRGGGGGGAGSATAASSGRTFAYGAADKAAENLPAKSPLVPAPADRSLANAASPTPAAAAPAIGGAALGANRQGAETPKLQAADNAGKPAMLFGGNAPGEALPPSLWTAPAAGEGIGLPSGGFTPSGLPMGMTRQEFAQVSASGQITRSAASDWKEKTSAVLKSFRMEQTGERLRIIDADGSIYEGVVGKRDGAGESYEAARRRVLGTAPVTANSAAATASYYFRVEGMNRSLNQVVRFSGDLVPMGAAAPQNNAKDITGRPLPPPPFSVSQAEVRGRVRIGEAGETQIIATPTKR